MAEDKNIFGMLDDISANQTEILNEITGVKTHVFDTDGKIAALEQEITKLKSQPTAQPKTVNPVPQKSNQEIFETFLRQSKKSWRWFGTKGQFYKSKALTIIALSILLIVGLISTIASSICFKLYSTFTFLENTWLIFGIIYLVYACKTRLIYDVNILSKNSSIKYTTDRLGMKFPRKERVVFKIFIWIAMLSVPFNIICIWGGLGKGLQAFATIMEVLYLAAIIFAYFVNRHLFAGYSIIWVEGRNLKTKERVVLVLPPGAKQLMPEEEFRKKVPFLYY